MAELKRIAICDDEIGTCSDLEKMILDYADRRAIRMETEVFYSGEAFYRSIQEQCQYDLVFLDFIVTSISVSLYFIFGMILEKAGKSRQERERELLEQEIRIYENQFGIIRQSQHNIRALKHDMKHHIKMLMDMVSQGENEAAMEYLASMGAFMENSEEYAATGNEKIDSILNYMISKAKDLGFDVSWKIQIPEHLEIPVFDINVILSNLFENAVNALADVMKPSFRIMMKYDRGILCISTQNNCSGKEQVSGTSEEHGFGLKNIQRIAEKYHLFVLCKRIQYGYIGIGAGVRVPDVFYSVKILTPLGFPFPGFRSSDYFPILPWMFLYLCGYFFNQIFREHNTWQAIACLRIPFLSVVGGRTIWIYLLHQPICMLVCSLVFG